MNNNQTNMNEMIESESSNFYPYAELEEYRDAVLDHFIIAFYGYDDEKTVYENLASLIAYYQEIALDPRVSKEANELHTKITELQAHVNQLREALEELLVAYRVAVKLYDSNHDDAYTVKGRNAIAKARNIKWK